MSTSQNTPISPQVTESGMTTGAKILLGVGVGVLGLLVIAFVVGSLMPHPVAQHDVVNPRNPAVQPWTPSTQTPAAAPVAAVAPGTTIPGDGTFMVGSEVQPGTYRSSKAREPYCYWNRSPDLDGSGVSGLGTSYHGEQTIVTIKAGDGSFKTSGCATWTRVK